MKRGIILLATMFFLVGCANGAKQEETEYYSIVDNGDYTYSYCIKDEEGKVLLQDKNCMKVPHIKQVNDEIVGVTIQGGTGQSTNWAKYCNVQTGRVSEAFQYVLGEQDEYVIFADRKEETCFVIVQNIFDKSAYYAEYELENVSPVAADFITGFDVTDNGEIMITYPTGDSYEEKELTIKIQ